MYKRYSHATSTWWRSTTMGLSRTRHAMEFPRTRYTSRHSTAGAVATHTGSSVTGGVEHVHWWCNHSATTFLQRDSITSNCTSPRNSNHSICGKALAIQHTSCRASCIEALAIRYVASRDSCSDHSASTATVARRCPDCLASISKAPRQTTRPFGSECGTTSSSGNVNSFGERLWMVSQSWQKRSRVR